jgi:DNA primase
VISVSSGKIDPNDIANLRSRVPIEDIIGQYVTLKRAGTNLSGLCPFHDESTPSFSVSPDRGLFHCFGCQESGDVYTFLQKIDDMSFVESVETIANKTGYTLTYIGGHNPEKASARKRLIQAHEKAVQLYSRSLSSLPPNHPGHVYLSERKFSADDIARFSIGYSPDEWTFLVDALSKEGFTSDELIEAGLATRSKNGKVFDRFRGRLMWPIFSASGEPVGFGARRLSDDKNEAKWLNTSETPIYHKSEILYGIHTARKAITSEQQVVIVEGYGDVMACHLSDIPTAVATSGTAFGAGHVKVLKRLFRDNDYQSSIVFTFDGDEAGINAARRSFPIVNQMSARALVAIAPDGKDPLDLRNENGSDALKELIANAVPLIEFVIQDAIQKYDISQPEQRITAVRAACEYLHQINDAAMLDLYVRKTAGWVGLPESSVSSTLQSYIKNRKSQDNTRAMFAPVDSEAATEASAEAQSALPDPKDPRLWNERELLKLLVQSELVTYVDLHPGAFTDNSYRSLFESWYALEQSTRNPFEQLKDSVPETIRPLLNELVVEPRQVSGDIATNIESLAGRVLAEHLQLKVSTLKAQLASADAEDAGSIMGQITALQKTIRDIARTTK